MQNLDGASAHWTAELSAHDSEADAFMSTNNYANGKDQCLLILVVVYVGITFFWWPIPEIGDISPVQRYYLQFSDISISITVHPYGIPISGIE